MIYIINVLLSTIYFYNLRKLKKVTYLYFMPILLLWTVIIGGQYDVGTDYFMYRMIFENSNKLYLYFIKKEYLFYYYVIFLKYLSNNPQFFFMMTGLIQNFLLVIIIKKLIKKKVLEIKYTYIFILIYLTAITVFYNQMNGIRQYIALYFFTMAILAYFLDKKILKYIILMLIGIYIHKSLLILFPIIFFLKYSIKQQKIYYIIFYIFCILIFFMNVEDILYIVTQRTIPRYSWYFESKYIGSFDLKNLVVKFIYFPVYFYGIRLIGKISKRKEMFLKIGLISYGIRICCLKIMILSRIGEYFLILTIFPLIFILEYFIEKNKYTELILFFIFILGIFIIKVLILPQNEYIYRSIFLI